MPTPSSHREPESLSFSSTCPDDQAPFPPPQPSWSPPALPSEHAGAPQSENTANTTTAGIVESSTPRPADGTGQTGRTGSQTPSPNVSSPSTLSPDPEPSTENHRPFASAETDEAETEGPLFFHTAALASSAAAETGATTIQSPVADVGLARLPHPPHPTHPTHPTQAPQAPQAQAPAATRRNSSRRARSTHFAVISTNNSWEPFSARLDAQRQLTVEGEDPARALDMPFPSGMDVDKLDEQPVPADMYAWDRYANVGEYNAADPTSLRVIPLPTSTFLRPGSRFAGTQQSERQQYDVQVEIKHVDLRESFLCGYLRIQGLTEDHPTLTTYFEGEIIGSKYGFSTKHENWGANDRTDMQHWSKFPAFHPFVRQAKKGNLVIKEYLQRENIFMRWKEHFLVPDHNIKSIHGASFEGFYYICFNQVQGLVHGIYFHSRSEKFQQLELKHINDRGCMSAIEFR